METYHCLMLGIEGVKNKMAVQKSYKERLADIAKHRAEMKKARAKKKAEKAAKKVAKQKAKNVKKIGKMAAKAEKKEKGAGLKSVSIGKKSDPSKLSPTGKIRRKAKGVEVTEGGAYAKYGKKSKAANHLEKHLLLLKVKILHGMDVSILVKRLKKVGRLHLIVMVVK